MRDFTGRARTAFMRPILALQPEHVEPPMPGHPDWTTNPAGQAAPQAKALPQRGRRR